VWLCLSALAVLPLPGASCGVRRPRYLSASQLGSRLVQVAALDKDGGELVAVERLVGVGGRVTCVAEPVRAEAFGELGGDPGLLVGS
jgi:hypothetical protein